MFSYIQGFKTKMSLWQNKVKSQTSDYFPQIKSFGTMIKREMVG